MPGVLVVTEAKDGKLKKVSREALSIGSELAASAVSDMGGMVTDAASAEEAGRYGAKKVYVAALGPYDTETYTAAVVQVIREMQPAVVLFAGSSNGRDLAPRVAARLGVGVASDVDRLDWLDGKLRARRPVYSGRVFVTVEITGTPAIATTRPNAFPLQETSGGAPEVVNVTLESSESRVKLVDTKVPDAGELSIAEADIIVSGGRGLKEAANFSYIRDLAHAIGGAVGASRATVDAGWIDHQHQVGQTGRVVSPNLYIAAGISGAIQHLAGMSSSKHIVAINKDPEAPIFRVADLGVVGDLFQILPALTEEVKKAKAH
ncbi:MAG: electron transfer flavoprotein subunit alpha/FixB family protein [Acidobacteriota bacterium]